MPTLDPSWLQVTPVVYEFLVVQIKEPLAGIHHIHYKIEDNTGNIIRKGTFSGMVIQLRMNFLKDGSYSIILSFENYDPITRIFEKRSQNSTDDMVITMYQ